MKRLVLAILLAIAFAFPLSAQAARTFGLVFEMNNLLLSISPYDDTYQAGAGAKWWMAKNLALRGLVSLDYNSNGPNFTTNLGLGAAIEYHPTAAKVSPYFGGLAGLRIAMDNGGNAVDLYFGGLGGAEISVWENVSAYAEYDLLASIDANGFTMTLGAAGSAHLGLIVYF